VNERTATGERPDYTFTEPEGLLAHTTSSAVFEHILPTHTLRLSPYRLMRDPIENKDFLPNISWHGSNEPEINRGIAEVDAHVTRARARDREMLLTSDRENSPPLTSMLR
jgi:formylglycine-generating enzyme required for sulfatase activity